MQFRSALFIAAAAVCGVASASLVVTDGATRTVDFESAIAGVNQWHATNAGSVSEPSHGFFTNPANACFALNTQAWAIRASSIDPDGAGPLASGGRTLFGSDSNGDGDMADSYNVSGMNVAMGGAATSPWNGSAQPNQSNFAPLAPNRWAVLLGQYDAAPWRDMDLTLRVQNGTGQAVSQWAIGAVTYYGDPDTANADLFVLYSTDNVNFAPLATQRTSDTNGSATWDRSAANQWAAFPVSQTVDLGSAVAAGDYLYIRFANSRVGGSGSGAAWLVDSVSVTATIPEPATLGLVGGMALVGLARRRRA